LSESTGGGNGRVRVFVVGAEDFRQLSLRDLIAASEVSGVDVTELSNLKGVSRIRGLAGMAWVIARRDEPDLTFEDVLDGRIESANEGASPLGTATKS
jgi:hypothetical protein